MAQAKRRLAAILAADVFGYSRLMSEDEDETLSALDARRAVFHAHVSEHGGRVVDTAGDSVLAVFETATGAVAAADRIQTQLTVMNANLPDQRQMAFRIGINLGEIIEKGDGTIYGDGVNVAARLEALADPGGVILSEDAFRQVDGKVKLSFADAGSHTVKNIAKPVRAYRVVPAGTAAAKPKRKTIVLAAALVVLIVVAGSGAWYWTQSRPIVEADTASVERMAFPLPQEPSIAVLPFDNLSGRAEHDFIADGLSENIISALSQARGMLVIARNSTFTYKGRPVKVQQVAEELGVQYVLEGSVQVSGDQIRVTAQLIDALSGRHMLSERYDRDLDDVFAVQDEITLNIVSALQVELTEGTQAIDWRGGTDDVEAWRLFQEGLVLHRKGTKENNARSRDLFQQAVDRDPNYALAWVYLGWAEWEDATSGYVPDKDAALARATAYAERAAEIGTDLVNVDALRPFIILDRDGDFEGALALAAQNVERAPNHAIAISSYGLLLELAGRSDEAIAMLKKAMRSSPYYPAWYAFALAVAYVDKGQYEPALPFAKEYFERQPNSHKGAPLPLLLSYAGLDRERDVQRLLAEAKSREPNLSLEVIKNEVWGYRIAPKVWESRAALFRKAGVPEHSLRPKSDKPSIAVLPFDNLSGDHDQEYFSDGITEDLITDLSKIPSLFVIARNSAFAYKNQPADVREIGRDLGVQYVLEGSVRKADGRVRINAKLVNATTGGHLWAERYDRELRDIFAIQDEISWEIATALELTLSESEKVTLGQKETEDLLAYDALLRARAYLYTYTKDTNAKARNMAETAIKLDPEYARAHAWLSVILFVAWEFQWDHAHNLLDRALQVAQRAVDLDENLADGHMWSGWILLWNGEHERATAELRKAISLEPSLASAYAFLGETLNYSGRPGDAIGLLDEAIQLDPKYPANFAFSFGHAYYLLGQHDEAISAFEDALARAPGFLPAHRGLAAVYVESGHMEKAGSAISRILDISPQASLELWKERLPYRRQDVLHRFVAALEKAGLPERSHSITD